GRAWRLGDAEPADWQAIDYTGNAGWTPQYLAVQGVSGVGTLEEWEVKGVGPLRLSPEQEREAALVAKLNEGSARLHREGKLPDGVEQARQALARTRKALPRQHPFLAMSLSNLAELLRELGQYDESRKRHEEALTILRRVLPPQHPVLATSLGNLGVLH